MTPVYLGADLGGTHLRLALRTPGASIPLDTEWMPASGEWGACELIEAMRSLLDRISARHIDAAWNVMGIGAALTGDIDLRAGTCHSMKRFPFLEEVPLAAHLEAA